MFRGSEACDHWRQLASCELDAELTAFELRGLERHRAACADCAAWMGDLGYIVDAIQTSERVEPREPVMVQRLRHRSRGRPALIAASASMGAAFLAVIAIALPGRSGLIEGQAMTGPRDVSIADPPPRSFVLAAYMRAQQPDIVRRRPYGAP